MDPIVKLLQQTSFESLFLLFVFVLASAKAFGELVDWAYKKLKAYFGTKENAVDFQDEVLARLSRIEAQCGKADENIGSLRETLQIVQERLQNSTRSYIIDKFHYYVYQIGAIDEAALQDLERRYAYYKKAGGDTFIENRMARIRELPLLSTDQLNKERQNSLDDFHYMLGTDDDDGR